MPQTILVVTAILMSLCPDPACGAGGDTPAVPQSQPATMQPEAASAQVEAILTRLEEAGRNVRAIRCKVVYTEKDELNFAETQKRGTVLFKRAEPHPMFLVHFEKTFDLVEDVKVGGEEWWLFRDRWFWQAKAKSRNTIKREVVPEGETIDVFDLTNSRIPMPFGQSKREILEAFTVKLTPPQVGDPADCDHLYCLPREGSTLARDYKRLDYYVSRNLHLPVRIIAVTADEAKVTRADFPDLAADNINAKVSDADFKLPAETQGYHVTEEPLEAAPRGTE